MKPLISFQKLLATLFFLLLSFPLSIPVSFFLTVGFSTLPGYPAYAVEMPPVAQLRKEIQISSQIVSVYDPHFSLGDINIMVGYVGYRAIDVFEHLFGENWTEQGQAVEFRVLDGYFLRIDIQRFLNKEAFFVFSRKDCSPFTVDSIRQNRTGVSLGPYYLVWDNVSNPDLFKEGDTSGPIRFTKWKWSLCRKKNFFSN